MSRQHPAQSSKDDLAATKLAIEKAKLAKLAKLEESLPKPAPQYTPYDEVPPPSPEDRERIIAELNAIYDKINAARAAQKKAWLLSMTDFAP